MTKVYCLFLLGKKVKIKKVLNSVNNEHIRRLLKALYHRIGPGSKDFTRPRM
jgi:hypothetical protein